MAIKVNGTTVIDDSRNISNVGTVTATSFSGDGSALTGISSTPTTADVLTATAGASVKAVGTYILAGYNYDVTAASGSTHAGSNLKAYGMSDINTFTDSREGSTLSGTWRAMGYLDLWTPATLFLRIA